MKSFSLLSLFLLCDLIHGSWIHNIDHTETACDVPCSGGACLFVNCQNPTCDGGACKFIDCENPSCRGGACVFENCHGATCAGGACDFIKPKDTLSTGYCAGDGCSLHGKPHPHLQNHLTL